MLLFYDGITGSTMNSDGTFLYNNTQDGRLPSGALDALGARFMVSLSLTDPYFMSGSIANIGWTSGSPFDYITSKEIPYFVQSLVNQGVTTSSTDRYCYINWTEDSREFMLFRGYTGPSGPTEISNHKLLSQTMAKILIGGTGSDGSTFFGLKHYFPGIKWGFYAEPPWPIYFGSGSLKDTRPENIWAATDAERTAYIDHAANVFISDPELMDALDMLMPSCYSTHNAPEINVEHNKQNIRLCNAINDKWIAQNPTKLKKLIIPFISPIWFTEASSTRYCIGDAFGTRGVNSDALPPRKYVPPHTIGTQSDIRYEAIEPILKEGADGALLWMSTAYRARQIVGRPAFTSEDTILGGYGVTSSCAGGGPTMPWSQKTCARQALNTYKHYIEGICMGITGTRWWWATEASGSTQFTPTVWLPLNTNKADGAVGSTTGMTGFNMVVEVLEGLKRDTLITFKTVWDELNL